MILKSYNSTKGRGTVFKNIVESRELKVMKQLKDKI